MQCIFLPRGRTFEGASVRSNRAGEATESECPKEAIEAVVETKRITQKELVGKSKVGLWNDSIAYLQYIPDPRLAPAAISVAKKTPPSPKSEKAPSVYLSQLQKFPLSLRCETPILQMKFK